MRRKILCLHLLTFMLLLVLVPGCPADAFVPGDVNGDAKVGLADAVSALQIMTGTNPAGQSINADADVNQDGIIGQEETLYTLQKLSGLRPAFLDEAPLVVTSDPVTQVSTYLFSGMVSPEVVSLRLSLNGGS